MYDIEKRRAAFAALLFVFLHVPFSANLK